MLAQHALEQLMGLPGATRAGFAVSEGGRRQLLFTASDRDDGTGSFEWCHVDASQDVPLNRAALHGELVAGTVDELAARFPAFARRQQEAGTCFVAAVPVTDAGEPLGGLVMFSDRPQVVDDRLRRRLRALGDAVGAGLVRARRAQRRAVPPAEDHPADGGSDGDLRASYEMPDDLRAVRQARRFLRTTLEGWGLEPDLVDDAVLCLAELVTNAVVHTHAGCRVRVRLGRAVLSVQVVDYGSLGPVRVAATVEEITGHGRGLQIVDALAARTGRDERRFLSWFELDLP